MGAEAEGGVEFFRLHGVRALAGLQVLVPFFETQPAFGAGRGVYPAGFVRLAF
jgi:hypothetical protein